jgi:hypothetical protein
MIVLNSTIISVNRYSAGIRNKDTDNQEQREKWNFLNLCQKQAAREEHFVAFWVKLKNKQRGKYWKIGVWWI